ncbi:MAG: hypothetical protein OHK0023_05900 [Anaerolineae bacterium]
MSEAVKTVEIFLPSILGYEKIARNAAAAIAQEMGFSDDRIDDLQTAVAEACMNAIEHGNREDGRAKVTVLMRVVGNELEIQVQDEGLTPIPEAFPNPGRIGEGGDNRGWGMFFIKQLMDDVQIKRLPEGGNLVKMVIHLTQDNEAPQPPTAPATNAPSPTEPTSSTVSASTTPSPQDSPPTQPQPTAGDPPTSPG